MSLPNIADVHGKTGLSASDSLGVSELLTINQWLSAVLLVWAGVDRSFPSGQRQPYCLLLHSLPEGNDFHRLASEAAVMVRVTNLKPKLAKCYPREFYPCLRRTL